MMSTWCRSEYLTATCLLKELTIQNNSYIQEHISIYFINLDRFQNNPIMVDFLAAILNLSKSWMMPAQHYLDYLTLKHHPTTKLSIKNYKTSTWQLQKYRSFSELKNAFRRPYWRPFYDSLWCQPVSIEKMTAAHPLTESTFKTYIHNTSIYI